MLKAAIDLNHFYGLILVNQIIRSIRGGFALLDIFDKKREHHLHEKKSIERDLQWSYQLNWTTDPEFYQVFFSIISHVFSIRFSKFCFYSLHDKKPTSLFTLVIICIYFARFLVVRPRTSLLLLVSIRLVRVKTAIEYFMFAWEFRLDNDLL